MKYQVDNLFLERVNRHNHHWIDKDSHYWYERLLQEVGELGGVLAGDHADPIELELAQVGGICLSWLRKMEREGTLNFDAVSIIKAK